MDMITFQTAHLPLTRITGPGLVRRLVERLLTWQRRASERRHLMQLDDRLLHDMGITRAEAEREYRTPFWR
ncbi:MAG: DUF1127 domain-containing protein [Kiloniellales bacterium]